MKDIAIIILNYNSSDFTLSCVRSILENSNSGLTYGVVVVDNHSCQEEFEKLKPLEGREDIQIIRNPYNSGFGGGNMDGIRGCQSNYYFFLNNDTRLLNDNLAILHGFMEKNPSAGVCSGQMYLEGGSRGINISFIPDLKVKLLGPWLLRLFAPEEFPGNKTRYDSPVRVPVLNGSSLFVRASAFDQAGGFDTTFFLYCEEEDLAIRMKNSGYSCHLVPEARFLHYGGKSSGESLETKFLHLKEFYISQHYLYRKHFGAFPAWVWRLTQFFRSLRKFYKDGKYFNLAFFILFRTTFRNSLRFREKNNLA